MSFRNFHKTGTVVALIAIAAYLVETTVAFADSISDAGASGQAFAQQIIPPANGLATSDGSGNLTLFPGNAAASSISVGQLFPDSASGPLSTYTSVYGNNASMLNLGTNAQSAYLTDSSPTGLAYQTVVGEYSVVKPNLSNDPVFATTDSTMSNLSTIAATFADCNSLTTVTPTTTTSHIPAYQHCEVAQQLLSGCTAVHSYTVNPPVNVTSGNATSCGDGCIQVTVGNQGNIWCHGSNNGERAYNLEYINTGSINVTTPSMISSVTLSQLAYNDFTQILVNRTPVYTSNPYPPFGIQLADTTGGSASPGIDLTSYFRAGGTVNLEQDVGVVACGYGQFTIQINYDPTKLITNDAWATPACLASITAFSDGFCGAGATATCTSMPTTDANGCAWIDNAYVCPSDFSSTAPSGFSPLCQQMTLAGCSGFNQGAMPCYTDAEGNTQCPVNDGSQPNGCAAEQSAGCGYISSNCVDGASGASGTCYVTEETWDCGNNVQVPSATKTGTLSCAGPIRCMGNDCVTQAAPELNTQFTSAVAAIQAAQDAAKDVTCTNPNDPSTCTIFVGTAGTCKKAVGGIVDCCNKPSGVSLGDYVTLLMAANKVDAAVGAPVGSEFQGAWELAKNDSTEILDSATTLASNAWSDVSSLWASAANSTTAATTASTSNFISHGVFSGVTTTLTENIANWVDSTFGDEAANFIFEAGSQVLSDGTVVPAGGPAFTDGVANGATEVSSELASAVSVVMWAYTVYSVSMVLIHLIWKCEQSEYTLDAHRDLKACHYVGSYCNSSVLGQCIESLESYCCFNSPLSRIMQEQARLQLGMSWGTSKSPNCFGLTVAQLGQVDWTKANLSEWIAILASTSNLPTVATTTMANLTGATSTLANGTTTPREDTAQRTVARLSGIDTNGIQNAAAAQLQNEVGPSVDTLDYHWSVWSACSASCGGGSQARTCTGSDGSTGYDPSLCGGGYTSQACNQAPCVSYTWQDSGSCSNSCGSGTETYACVNAATGAAAPGQCAGSPPSVSCSSTSGCPVYTYGWVTGQYGACSGGVETRTVACGRSDGTVVAGSNCTAPEPPMTVSCAPVNGACAGPQFNPAGPAGAGQCGPGSTLDTIIGISGLQNYNSSVFARSIPVTAQYFHSYGWACDGSAGGSQAVCFTYWEDNSPTQ